MKILVIGGGAVAEELLSKLDLKQHEVIVVEKDPLRRKDISLKFDVYVIDRDATDISLYTSDIRMDEIDAVIALTGRNEINLFVLAIARMYDVPFRLAKVTDTRIADLLIDLGLGVPICQPSLVATMIANYLQSIREPYTMGSLGGYNLYLITLAETDRAVGMKISELDLPSNVKVILLFDGSRIYYPVEDTILKSGYQLLVLGSSPNIIKYFKG